jgi:hypothetical protein
MKRLYRMVPLLVLLGLACFTGWGVYQNFTRPPEPPPTPVPPTRPPLTDWERVYKIVNGPEDGEDSAYILVGVSSDPEYNEYILFLVDGDRWYYLEHGILRGCGPVQDVYYSIHTFTRLRGKMKDVPGPNARFVVRGPGRPKLMEAKVKFKGDPEE